MHRLLFSLLAVLTLFSCSKYLAINQVNTKNVSVEAGSAPVDSLVDRLVKPYRDSISRNMKQPVAFATTALIKGKPESKLTNLVTDIVLNSSIDFCTTTQKKFRPDLAYMNYGGLRASLPQGEITVGNIFELMPFENELVLIHVSGEAVQQMAERIAARGGEGVAGITIGIQDNGVKTLKVNGSSVDKTKTYWIATNDYIANGGDQMSMFANPLDKIETRLKIRDILIHTLREMNRKDGKIDVKLDGRIYNE